MKKKFCLAGVWLITLSLVLTFCVDWGGQSSDPSADKTCKEGVCAEITVLPPVVLNKPTDITVRISSTVDYPNLLIVLQASPTNAKFGEPASWNYDAAADQSQVFHSTVTFQTEGEWLVGVVAFDNKRGGPVVSNQDRVLITSTGFVINRTIDPNQTLDSYPPIQK
jgi:hypothetical protein